MCHYNYVMIAFCEFRAEPSQTEAGDFFRPWTACDPNIMNFRTCFTDFPPPVRFSVALKPIETLAHNFQKGARTESVFPSSLIGQFTSFR
jgi:hypothetical protein